MSKLALSFHPVAQIVIVDYMIGAHKTRKGEGLAGGVEGDDPVLCILGHGLGGYMLMAGHDNVGPYLVGDDHAVIGGVDLHSPLYLPSLPDSAAGIVGGAEYGKVDIVCLELSVHVLIVHAPDALGIPLQWAVDRDTAGVGKGMGKAHIGGRMDQNLLTGGGKGADCRADPAQHTVFIADMPLFQSLHTVAPALPVDDGRVILGAGIKVAEVRKLHTAADLLQHGGRGGKAHVGDPHGDGIKALVHAQALKGYPVGGDKVMAGAVKNGSKVVFHICIAP